MTVSTWDNVTSSVSTIASSVLYNGMLCQHHSKPDYLVFCNYWLTKDLIRSVAWCYISNYYCFWHNTTYEVYVTACELENFHFWQ